VTPDDDPALRVAPRTGLDELPAHLNTVYGVDVDAVSELDLGTLRVALHDGRTWVARVHPRQRPLAEVKGDAEILGWLAGRDYPAERIPDGVTEPVSTLDGQPVIVTEGIRWVARGQRRAAVVKAGGLRALGALLARLQALQTQAAPKAAGRPGGAWHHLADGAPRAELAAARVLLDDVGAPDALHTALDATDAGDGLPDAFAHPDFVMANVVCAADRDDALILVDWSGAGRAPRVWPLAFLLWSLGAGGDLARVDRAVDGYRRGGGELSAAELDRLPAVVAARPVVFDAWAYATGRRTATEAVRRVAESREIARRIAGRTRAAFQA
jgi:Ser/Thr protein kinase RdoA (MazF antagonist)